MKPTLVESMLPASERVATGEIPIALTFVKFAYSAAQSGAPLEYVRLERMLGDTHFVVLGSKAPHPNAGKAFVDFYLDDEAMKILAQSGEFVNRKGIYPPLPGADKIQYLQMEVLEAKTFEDRRKEGQDFSALRMLPAKENHRIQCVRLALFIRILLGRALFGLASRRPNAACSWT
jgi:iron(III) transport system substrate-binding protein